MPVATSRTSSSVAGSYSQTEPRSALRTCFAAATTSPSIVMRSNGAAKALVTPRITSISRAESWRWRGRAFNERVLAHKDFDAAIARLGDAIGGRYQQVALAPSRRLNVSRRHAAANQLGAHRLGALTRERVVEWIAADGIGMSDHIHIGYGSLRDLGEDHFDGALRIFGELILAFDEVKRERDGPLWSRSHRRAEFRRDFFRRRRVGAQAKRRLPCGGVRLIKYGLATILFHDDSGRLAILFGQQHDGSRLRAAAERCQQRDHRPRCSTPR